MCSGYSAAILQKVYFTRVWPREACFPNLEILLCLKIKLWINRILRLYTSLKAEVVWQTWNRRLSKIPSDLAFTVHEAKTGLNSFPFFLPNSVYNNPAANLFSACHSLSEAVSLLHLNPCFLSFCVILCFWVTSSRDRKRESFLHKEDCLSRPIIFCYIGSRTLCVRVCVCVSNLFLQVRLSEGEQEFLDVFRAQAVDAARVDGPAQKLIHLVLWV